MAYDYPNQRNLAFAANQSNSIFTGDRDHDGTIYSIGMGRERLKVGIDIDREQELLSAISEMQETLDNWRNVLIENGLLKIPKTADELAAEAASEQLRFMQQQAQEQAGINQALLRAIEGLNATVEEMKNNGNTSGNDSAIVNRTSTVERTQNLKNNGKKRSPNKVSTGTGKENPA